MNYISEAFENMKKYFNTDITKSVHFRQESLKALGKTIKKYQDEINAALKQDLNKSAQESYMTEIGLVIEEVNYAIKHLSGWARPKGKRMPLAQFPSKANIIMEPYGLVLIISPWNYPFLLTMAPFIGAIAAGNCCIIKPSEFSPHTSAVMAKIIKEAFNPYFATVIEGDAQESQQLLEKNFDYIFFTGSPRVGQIVMTAAAKHLTPVTLELGGKSPCIVMKSANIDMAAKRIAFGKFLNAGQTCVAPDYILVDNSVKEQLLESIKKHLEGFFGHKPLNNQDYPKIITPDHYNRLMNLIKGEKVFLGGKGNDHTGKIEPTILAEVTWDSPVMAEEIFGPILPVIGFNQPEEALYEIKQRDKPLALYLFTKDPFWERAVMNTISFGGGCINDTVIHLSSTKLPFGGVGNSGMGSYHGKYSFDTFSHKKTVVRKRNHPDINLRYHPYSPRKLRWIRKFMG